MSGPPPTIISHRNEPIHPRMAFPWGTDRYTVDVNIQEAPKPVQDTTFYGVGRDPEHVGNRLMRWCGGLAIPEWQSIIGWPFGVAKVPSALVVSMATGRQNPLRERVNIKMPQQTTLGDMTAADGAGYSSPGLEKLVF